MTKKPSNLNLKDKVTTKRTHDNYKDFNTRRKHYEELKKLRQDLKEKKEAFIEKERAERERLAEKKRRKEINMLKSGGYEIIQNTQKIKKWKRKARKMLQKLPPELFYEKAK